MKSLLLLLIILSPSAKAVSFAVIGPCSEKAAYTGAFKADLDESVGLASIHIFEANKIPFVGTVDGMNTIMNTPVGDEALEVLSDTKMRAYGWCFSINGVIPDVLSNEITFSKQNDHLNWFFAYSTYDQGVWTDYCVPSHKIKAKQFCKKP